MADNASAPRDIERLYDLYAEDVYRFARLTLGDDELAYDVVQEVFLRAFRAWPTFRREANAKTWILSIARNYIYDVFRKRRTERDFLSSHPPHVDQDDSASADSRLQIEEALSRLKVEYRQVIALRHIDGRSVPETARILGWSDAKVRTTTNRALAKLREILGGEETRDAGRQGV